MTINALKLANSNPYAICYLKGTDKLFKLKGTVEFFPWSTGSIIKLEIVGLPTNKLNNFFGFHIHKEGVCNMYDKEPFSSAGPHYDKSFNMHPNHTGDLPMIYSNNGYAFMLYYTNRFTPDEAVGKSVIIHEMMDDLMTEPSRKFRKKNSLWRYNKKKVDVCIKLVRYFNLRVLYLNKNKSILKLG